LSETDLHLISTVFVFGASIIPIYLSLNLKKGPLRMLTITLTFFILVHGIYHITGFLGFNLLAEGLFEPLSIIILIFFGVVYLNTILTKRQKIKA
jgi:hypothetical protein